MFTLSDASDDTKKILKWLGIGLVAIICLFLLIKALLFIKEVFYPTPPPKPTVAFGKLQPAFFPGNITGKKFTYSINTNSGNLPSFPGQIKVYVINPNEPDLLGLSKMQAKFYNGGFAGKPVELSNQLYRWSSDPLRQGIPKTIDGNIVDSSFTINSNFINDSFVLSGKNLPNERGAIEVSSSFLQNMSFLSKDLDLTKTKTKLFSIQGGRLAPSTSVSNSQVIEVDYYQADINKLPIYYEDSTASNIGMLVAGSLSGGEIVGGKYANQSVTDRASTYPIITSDEAFDKLKKGQSFISSYFGTGTQIAITNVFLAYYISSKPQDFAIPVFVFQGNDGFYAYVPAVTDEWTNK